MLAGAPHDQDHGAGVSAQGQCDSAPAAARGTGHDGHGLADCGHTGSQLGGRFSRNAANASAMLSP
jgi:hypothetical protein